MKKERSKRFEQAQAALEYMLLLAVVVAVVLVAFQDYWPRIETASELYFNETANVIFGRDPVQVPINGGWSAWSGCSKPCDDGTGPGVQTRQCNNPAPSNGGTPCSCSDPTQCNFSCATPPCETRTCNDFLCPPVACTWSTWGACSAPGGCGWPNFQTRTCDCPTPAPPTGYILCPGASAPGESESQPCPYVPCIGPTDGGWCPWSACTDASGAPVTCGGGSQTRTCDCPPPANGGQYCPPDADGLSLVKTCNTQGCDCTGGFNYTTADGCGDVTIPNALDGQVLTLSCPAGCGGQVTASCSNGLWVFLTDNCTQNCGNGICEAGEATDPVCCADCAQTCNDSFCCAASGEAAPTCCECSSCGDGTCHSTCGEDLTSCCADCDTGCGDGNCCPDPPWNEDTTTCSPDCGPPPCSTNTLAGPCGSVTFTGPANDGDRDTVSCGGSCTGTVTGECQSGNWAIISDTCCDTSSCVFQLDCSSCEALSCCGWCNPLDPFDTTFGCCDSGNPQVGCSPPPPPGGCSTGFSVNTGSCGVVNFGAVPGNGDWTQNCITGGFGCSGTVTANCTNGTWTFVSQTCSPGGCPSCLFFCLSDGSFCCDAGCNPDPSQCPFGQCI